MSDNVFNQHVRHKCRKQCQLTCQLQTPRNVVSKTTYVFSRLVPFFVFPEANARYVHNDTPDEKQSWRCTAHAFSRLFGRTYRGRVILRKSKDRELPNPKSEKKRTWLNKSKSIVDLIVHMNRWYNALHYYTLPIPNLCIDLHGCFNARGHARLFAICSLNI